MRHRRTSKRSLAIIVPVLAAWFLLGVSSHAAAQDLDDEAAAQRRSWFALELLDRVGRGTLLGSEHAGRPALAEQRDDLAGCDVQVQAVEGRAPLPQTATLNSASG